MGNREEVIKCIEATKVVAIIRGMAPEICVKLAKAYQEGGIRLVEVTFNQAGTLEDTVTAIKELQPLACLLSAACGKDPGYSPTSMLEYVARRHYNQVEIDEKISPKGVYDAAELCRFWHDRRRLAPHHRLTSPSISPSSAVIGRKDDERK